MDEIERVVAELDRLGRRPLLVAIDGMSASGKSTIAARLAALYPTEAAVVSGDDFYRVMDQTERFNLSPAEG